MPVGSTRESSKGVAVGVRGGDDVCVYVCSDVNDGGRNPLSQVTWDLGRDVTMRRGFEEPQGT